MEVIDVEDMDMEAVAIFFNQLNAFVSIISDVILRKLWNITKTAKYDFYKYLIKKRYKYFNLKLIFYDNNNYYKYQIIL